MKMTRFTAATRVLSRWMVYGTLAAIALRLWGEGMFYLAHLVTPHPACGGMWFSSSLDFSLHLMMLLGMTVASLGIAAILWLLGLWLKDLGGAFVKAVGVERHGR